MNRSLVLVLVAGIVAAAACSRQQAAPPAPVAAADSVAEFPDYPGAVRIAAGQRPDLEHGFARTSEASWTSTDPYATIAAYYQQAIAGRGWTVTGTKSKATEVEWRLAKGTSVGKVEVKQGPGTQVTIKIERSDR